MAWESFPMLNLTFDPYFKGKWGRYTKNVFISPLLLVLWLQNVKTDHEKGMLWSRESKTPSVCASIRASILHKP